MMLEEDKYMTITAMAYIESGKFNFSGRHQDIMIYRSGTSEVELINTDGICIGFEFDVEDSSVNDNLSLNKGDAMLVYTDGITEAALLNNIDEDGKPKFAMFGQEKLRDVFLKLGGKSPEEIKRGILDELELYESDDDITMVVLKRLE